MKKVIKRRGCIASPSQPCFASALVCSATANWLSSGDSREDRTSRSSRKSQECSWQNQLNLKSPMAINMKSPSEEKISVKARLRFIARFYQFPDFAGGFSFESFITASPRGELNQSHFLKLNRFRESIGLIYMGGTGTAIFF